MARNQMDGQATILATCPDLICRCVSWRFFIKGEVFHRGMQLISPLLSQLAQLLQRVLFSLALLLVAVLRC
jgi:hypothetical protein